MSESSVGYDDSWDQAPGHDLLAIITISIIIIIISSSSILLSLLLVLYSHTVGHPPKLRGGTLLSPIE